MNSNSCNKTATAPTATPIVIGNLKNPPHQNSSWDETFSELVDFQKEHGHLDCSANNCALHVWMVNQRMKRESLTVEQVKKLQSIGFDFGTGPFHEKAGIKDPTMLSTSKFLVPEVVNGLSGQNAASKESTLSKGNSTDEASSSRQLEGQEHPSTTSSNKTVPTEEVSVREKVNALSAELSKTNKHTAPHVLVSPVAPKMSLTQPQEGRGDSTSKKVVEEEPKPASDDAVLLEEVNMNSEGLFSNNNKVFKTTVSPKKDKEKVAAGETISATEEAIVPDKASALPVQQTQHTGAEQSSSSKQNPNKNTFRVEEDRQQKRNRTWEESFQILRSFKEKHGHLMVSRKYDPSLSNWSYRQRRKQHALTKEQIDNLNSIGFRFERHLRTWNESFAALKSFQQKYGHLNCGSRYSVLASWCTLQRKSQYTLSTDQIAKLTSIGFNFESGGKVNIDSGNKKKVDGRTKDAEEQGPCVEELDRPTIASFASVSDCGGSEVSKEPIVAGTSNGHGGTVDSPKTLPPITWHDMFQRLKAHREAFGNCMVPENLKVYAEVFGKTKGTHADTELETWVKIQRVSILNGSLLEEYKEKLKSIEFETPKNVEDYEDWLFFFRRLVQFRWDEGHCVVPRRYSKDKSLGNWVNKQRYLKNKNILRNDRKKLLDKIGFVWDASIYRFTGATGLTTPSVAVTLSPKIGTEVTQTEVTSDTGKMSWSDVCQGSMVELVDYYPDTGSSNGTTDANANATEYEEDRESKVGDLDYFLKHIYDPTTELEVIYDESIHDFPICIKRKSRATPSSTSEDEKSTVKKVRVCEDEDTASVDGEYMII